MIAARAVGRRKVTALVQSGGVFHGEEVATDEADGVRQGHMENFLRGMMHAGVTERGDPAP